MNRKRVISLRLMYVLAQVGGRCIAVDPMGTGDQRQAQGFDEVFVGTDEDRSAATG